MFAVWLYRVGDLVMQKIIDQITYKKGWQVKLFDNLERSYIQLHVDGICSISGKAVFWVSGKRFLSKHMTNQEVVGTVFSLIKEAEEHEMREFFRYKGASIFNPHLDPNKLAEFARDKDNFNYRSNSMVIA